MSQVQINLPSIKPFRLTQKCTNRYTCIYICTELQTSSAHFTTCRTKSSTQFFLHSCWWKPIHCTWNYKWSASSRYRL